jgi:hypothetical protein
MARLPELICPVSGNTVDLIPLPAPAEGKGFPCILRAPLWKTGIFPAKKAAADWLISHQADFLAGAEIVETTVQRAGHHVVELTVQSPHGWSSTQSYPDYARASFAFGLGAKPATVEVIGDPNDFKDPGPTAGMEPETDDPDPDDLLSEARRARRAAQTQA